MEEAYHMRNRAEQTFDQSPYRTDDEDVHSQQSELQDLPIHDDVTLKSIASNSPIQDKSIISVLEHELVTQMAKLKVDGMDKLSEKTQQTQERIEHSRIVDREEMQMLTQLKALVLLDDTVKKLKYRQADEDSTSVEKLYQLEKELNNGLTKFQIDDTNKLPEKIQQTQERIGDDRAEEAEKQIEILTELKRLTLLDETITELKSTQSVEESSIVMGLSYVEEELINGMANLKVDDVKKLPKKIQQTEERIRDERDEEAEKQIEILTELKRLTIIDGAITKLKSTRSVEGSSSSVMKPHRFEQDSPTLPQQYPTNNDYQVESDDRSTTSEGNKRCYQHHASNRPAKRFHIAPQRSTVPEFFLPLPEVRPVRYKPLREKIQQKYRELCRWSGQRFPGSEPVPMHRKNYANILQLPYMVTWKPVGKRYMMLIEEENKVYMLNQGKDLFSVDEIRFPYDADNTTHLKDTLVDGEVVCDKINGSNEASFFINDIIIYNGTDVTAYSFPDRLKLISESIVNIHNNAITKGTQPFRIRIKQFFRLSDMDKLLSREFRASIPHEVEGLFFLPERKPYRAGECPDVLKWKENETIDFRLNIVDNGAHPEKKAHLFLSRMNKPFAKMHYSSYLQKYDNKIVSCYYRDSDWYVYRLRHDRRYPNSEQTAMTVMNVMEKPVTKEDLRDLMKNQSTTHVHDHNSSWAT
ncbi:hypothetical protein I4U23_016408 [Adineta vaga]|nr:hypothetical protein I4U23_016408 [Adineta vaga]